ncbi:unnamed protein product [Lota lota]
MRGRAIIRGPGSEARGDGGVDEGIASVIPEGKVDLGTGGGGGAPLSRRGRRGVGARRGDRACALGAENLYLRGEAGAMTRDRQRS